MTAITDRLRQWHPPHCAGPDSCDCGHEEAAAEIEDLRSLLRCVLDGWGADVDDNYDFGGQALIFNPGGVITARRRIAEHQVGVFWRAYGQEPRP